MVEVSREVHCGRSPLCCLSLCSPMNVSQMVFHLLGRSGKWMEHSFEYKVSHGNPNCK